MNRTAVIYKPDEFSYIVTLRYEDRDTVTVRYDYNDTRGMMDDIIQHLGCSCPRIGHGKAYSGDIRGLLVAINRHKGCLNIRYNVSANPEEIAEIFRNVTVNQLMM